MIGLSPLKIPQSHIGLVQLTSFFISVAPAEISHPLKMAWAAPEAANVLSLLGGHTGDTECYTAKNHVSHYPLAA